MTTREKPIDRARRLAIERLGKIYPTRLIEAAIESIRNDSDAAAFGDDPATRIADWILADQTRQAREAHASAQRRDKEPDDGVGAVVKLDQRRAAG